MNSQPQPNHPNKKQRPSFYFGLFVFFNLIFSTISGQWNTNQPIRMFALGDSYTIGQSVQPNLRWPEQLLDSLVQIGYTRDTLQIIATTGWRTDQLLSAIEGKKLKSKNFNLISLLIGVNNQYQGVPISLYKPHLLSLIDSSLHYLNNDTSRLLLVSITDYAYTPFGQQSSNPFLISQQLDDYNVIAKGIADSLKIAFFNITPISRRGLIESHLVATDGLHPSGLQYSRWVERIINKVDSTRQLSVSEIDITDFKIFNRSGEILIESSADNPLRSIHVYSTSGNCLFREDLLEPNRLNHFNLDSFIGSVVILYCRFEKNQAIQKLFLD